MTSPTLAAQWKAGAGEYPQAKLVQYEPVNQDAGRAASKAAFGDYFDTQYKLEDADVILAWDADFLGGIGFLGFLLMPSAWAERHRFDKDKPSTGCMSWRRMPTVTGFKAEHRLCSAERDDQFANRRPRVEKSTLKDPEAQNFCALRISQRRLSTRQRIFAN